MNVRRSIVLSMDARRWIALVLATILSSMALPAFAAGTCTGEGPGLHIFDPDDGESGVGGTGHAPRPRAVPLFADDDEENGIGGTGVRPHQRGDDDESGIGGTGLLGPIRVLDEGHGSSKPRESRSEGGSRICLNGLEIDVPESLALESGDGSVSTSAAALVSGRMAWVEAQSVDGRLVATRVLLAEDRVGWLEAVGRGDGSRGTRATPSARGPVSQPKRHPGGMLEGVGRWALRASGVRVHVVAETLVHRDVVGRTRPTFRQGTWIRYQGFATNANTFYATRIDLGPKGRSIIPEKRLDERVAERLRAEPGARPDYVSIEGYVKGTAEQPEIGGLPIALPDRASEGARETLQPGRRARVGGRLGRDGEILARPPPPALRPQRSQPQRPSPMPSEGPSEGPNGGPSEGLSEGPRDASPKAADDLPSPAPGQTEKPRSDVAKPVRVERPDGRPTRPMDVPVRPTRIVPDRRQIVRPPIERMR